MIYNSIENLPVWNFFKIIETGNLKYLDSREKLRRHADKIWNNILQEYYKKTGTNAFEIYKTDSVKLLQMQFDYEILLLLFYIFLGDKQNRRAKKLLKSYNIDPKAWDVSKKIHKKLKELKNKINIKAYDVKKKNEAGQGDKIDVNRLKDRVEKYKGFRIDLKIITVSEWIGIIQNMNQEAKQDKKHG